MTSRPRKYRKAKNKRARVTIVVVSLLLLLVIVVSSIIVYRLIKAVNTTQSSITLDSNETYFKQISWNSNQSVYLLLMHRVRNSADSYLIDKMGILKVDQVNLNADYLSIDPKMSLTDGSSYIEADLLYALGNLQTPSEGISYLTRDIESTFGIPVEAYIVTDGNFNGLIKAIPLKGIYSNLSIASINLINNTLQNVGAGNVSTIDSTNYLTKNQDGKNILDSDKYDNSAASQIQDIEVYNEHARVEVYNASSITGAASSLARELSNVGMNVTRVDTLPNTYGTGIVVYTTQIGSFSQTLYYIKLMANENITIESKDPDFFHTGDIQVIINN